jgi:hypothetical protein
MEGDAHVGVGHLYEPGCRRAAAEGPKEFISLGGQILTHLDQRYQFPVWR